MSQVAPILVRVGSYFVPREELASIAEVAEILGVTRRTAHRYVDRDDFPKPLGRIAAGRVWLRSHVEMWAKETLPLQTGRPRKDS